MDTKVHKKGIWRKLVQNWRTSVLWFRPSWVKKCRVWRSPHFLSLLILSPPFILSLFLLFSLYLIQWFRFEWKEIDVYFCSCNLYFWRLVQGVPWTLLLSLFFYHSLCISFIDFFTWSKVCCVNTITSFQWLTDTVSSNLHPTYCQCQSTMSAPSLLHLLPFHSVTSSLYFSFLLPLFLLSSSSSNSSFFFFLYFFFFFFFSLCLRPGL